MTPETRVVPSEMGVTLRFGADQRAFVRVRIRERALRERFLQRVRALAAAAGASGTAEDEDEEERDKEEQQEREAEEAARPPPAKRPAVLSRYARPQTRGARLVAMAKKALGKYVAPPPRPAVLPPAPTVVSISSRRTSVPQRDEEEEGERQRSAVAAPRAPPPPALPLQSLTRRSTAAEVRPLVRPREPPQLQQKPKVYEPQPQSQLQTKVNVPKPQPQPQPQPQQQQKEPSKPEENDEVLCGLRNLGNTCYLNAVLQALLALPPFVHALTALVPPAPAPATAGVLTAPSVATALADLVRARTAAPALVQSPARVKAAVGRVGAQFAGSAQQDAHELLVVLLDALNDELAPRVPAGTPTPVAATFRAELAVAVECTQCHAASRHAEHETCLSLSLPAAAPLPDVAACVAAFFRDEPLACTCAHCGCTAAVKHTRLHHAPRVLVLHLKRFVHQRADVFAKSSRPVAISPTLALARVLDPDAAHNSHSSSTAATYRLVAAVHHRGPCATRGHYTAYVRSRRTGTWALCDDHRVVRVDGHPSPSTDAYLLFYEALFP